MASVLGIMLCIRLYSEKIGRVAPCLGVAEEAVQQRLAAIAHKSDLLNPVTLADEAVLQW